MIAKWTKAAKIVFAVHAAVAYLLLGAFLEDSDHSDGRLFLLALGIELAGFLAVAFRSGRPAATGESAV